MLDAMVNPHMYPEFRNVIGIGIVTPRLRVMV